jgi:chromosomal replication initiator protein
MPPVHHEATVPNWPEGYQAAYRFLEQSILPSKLTTWIQPLQIVKTEKSPSGTDRIEFRAPNDFSASWVRDHYKQMIESAFAQISGIPCEAVFTVDESTTGAKEVSASELIDYSEQPSLIQFDDFSFQETKKANEESKRTPFKAAQTPVSFERESLPSRGPTGASPIQGGVNGEGPIPTVTVPERPSSQETKLNPNYTFDSFVVGTSNQFAHASAIAVADHPAAQFNPLFLYSRPGLGKTHLLHAIGNRIREKNPNAKVAYLSAERFVTEMIEMLQHRRMAQFRAKYRDSYDVLMIDDIQFIAGKTAIEEEFFHTFNALHGTKRQIVITSDRPPQEIEKLEERMRTRFEWGMVVDMQPPDIETRIAILKSKSERDDIYLPDDVATFLATHVKNNIRVLEGHLVKLQMHASLSGSEISLDMARQQLKAVVPEESPKYTVEMIQGAVAQHFQIRTQDFKSPTRAQRIALPRQMAMYLIRRYTGLGFTEIGSYFGDRDRTTVMHACETIEKKIDQFPDIKKAIETIQNLL